MVASIDLIRSAAKQAIQSAVLEEINEFVDQFKSLKLEDGKLQVVKNGYHPERSITTGVGTVAVTVPRSRDRKNNSNITFNSSLIPPYMRRAKSLDELLPLLYLKGLSTNSFQSALAPILGDKAKNISPNVICRLKEGWLAELEKWKAKPLTNKQYVYWWVDGVYLSARMESEKTCVLVIIGATEDGKKELVAFNDGFRESTDSWLELLREIKSRGLTISPNLAIGDGIKAVANGVLAGASALTLGIYKPDYIDRPPFVSTYTPMTEPDAPALPDMPDAPEAAKVTRVKIDDFNANDLTKVDYGNAMDGVSGPEFADIPEIILSDSEVKAKEAALIAASQMTDDGTGDALILAINKKQALEDEKLFKEAMQGSSIVMSDTSSKTQLNNTTVVSNSLSVDASDLVAAKLNMMLPAFR